MIVEGVEHDANGVALSQRGVTQHFAGDDASGMWLVRPDGEVQLRVVVEDPELGALGGRRADDGFASE